MKLTFPCLNTGGCAAVFSMATMKAVLDPPVFKNFQFRLQQEEVRDRSHGD